MWRPVSVQLNASLNGEQMVCSMSTQLFHIPQTSDLQGNEEMHTHLVPASYHRVTAVGSAERLLNGEYHPSIVETMISCMQSAEQRDRNVRAGLMVMRDAAPASFKPFIENIIRWQDVTEMHLRNARLLSMQITGPAPWQAQAQ